MMGAHHHLPMIVHIIEEELRKSLINHFTPETIKRGINNLIILNFILIIGILMININHDIKKHVVFMVYITMSLLNVAREWQKERG